MSNKCTLRMAEDDYKRIHLHLFPGDNDEHGLVILAGMSIENGVYTFYVREIHFAVEGRDYVEGKIGYRALSPTFIHKMITRARDNQLVYLAVHNHGSDNVVAFSKVDFQSHQCGYPALLQINNGVPVGALVFGKRSIEADIWLKDHKRLSLEKAVVVGNVITELGPMPEIKSFLEDGEWYERQIRLFGVEGQAKLSKIRVAIIGLGGVGSIVAELLARLGIQNILIIDPDKVDSTNISRIVGSFPDDAITQLHKTKVAERLIKSINPTAIVDPIVEDVAKQSVAIKLATCDYIFLAADSMRARLVVNAIVHQYLIPAVQIGSKIRVDSEGKLLDVMCANRPIRPGNGCLWCNKLIDPTLLAKEAKTDAERMAQAYGTEEPNPSVISLNAVAASTAVNDFMMDYLALRTNDELTYEHFHFLSKKRQLVTPRKDQFCSECSSTGERFGSGARLMLPCIEE